MSFWLLVIAPIVLFVILYFIVKKSKVSWDTFDFLKDMEDIPIKRRGYVWEIDYDEIQKDL